MSKVDVEVMKDLRESVDSAWKKALQLGLLDLDKPPRKRLRELAAEARRKLKVRRSR